MLLYGFEIFEADLDNFEILDSCPMIEEVTAIQKRDIEINL